MSVCVNCRRHMKVKQIGVALVETVGRKRKSHYIRQADIEACPKCGAQIIVRVADEGIEHFQEGFTEAIIDAHNQKKLYYVHER